MIVQHSNGDWYGPPYDARVVANFILRSHYERAEEITQLRLYKLLYFSHGWYLTERSIPLVWNNFEAWENGPVIKIVRDNFAKFEARPIDSFSSFFDLRRGQSVDMPRRLRADDEEFVATVVTSYARYSAGQLSQLTHAKGSPWDLIWKAKKPVGRFGLRLTNDEILRDFQDVASSTDSSYMGSPPIE